MAHTALDIRPRSRDNVTVLMALSIADSMYEGGSGRLQETTEAEPSCVRHESDDYLEAGCTWVPYMLNRMDEEWEKRGDVEASNCNHKPSTYIRSDRVFIHAESGEDLMPQEVEILGENSLAYASDWPHWDHEYPESVEFEMPYW